MRIGVLMGGMSGEREVSLKGGTAIHRALLEKGYNAIPIDVGRDVAKRLMDEGIEVAFIVLHGRYGEDGTIQGLLEIMGIPYTGSGVLASAIALDKVLTKKVLAFHDVHTPPFRVVKVGGNLYDGLLEDIGLPLVVKPSCQGSTIGVTVVREREGLRYALEEAWRYGERAVVERFIDGREVTVGILNGKTLPIIEIRPKTGIYDYRSKYPEGRTEYIVPAVLEKGIEERVKWVALEAYNALGCRVVARVDIMLDRSGNPYVLEVNTIPGMTELSLVPKAAACAGMGFSDLVEEILLGIIN
ncbi:MAG: D-alanine--D-alanine ligase [Deltaproteobacteria bacterium]|nr:D-alanine--D-alanine ligase [Deltaproteobacteria bacterium]